MGTTQAQLHIHTAIYAYYYIPLVHVTIRNMPFSEMLRLINVLCVQVVYSGIQTKLEDKLCFSHIKL